MQHTVDEHGGRSVYLARRCPTLDVAGHAQEYGSADPVSVEPRDVELELGCALPQAVVFECRLAMKEQRVHLPEAALESRSFGSSSRGEGVRMDLGQRKVPEREADLIAHPPLDAFDLSKRLS